jgi:lysophospholipase L1-like esterase
MKSTPSGDAASVQPARVVDSKPYVEHDPTIGYRYIPSTRKILPRPGGGEYTLVTNSIGIRSEREYAIPKPAGVFRIVVLGDSFAAGQFVSNDQRFTEILERRLPGVEAMNFALEGTGTDQQLLIFETMAKQFDPDLVILMPFLQNIRRNLADSRASYDPVTLKPVLVPKPRFELHADGTLKLLNVPVSKERKPIDESTAAEKTDIDHSLKHWLKYKLNGLFFMPLAKKIIYRLRPWEPFPEYKSENTHAWKVMDAIIRRLHSSSAGKPLVIVPIFYSSYVMYPMARNYWERFNSLTKIPGVFSIDLLPYFKKRGRSSARCFQDPHDVHFSAEGNLVLADAIERELNKLGLLKSTTTAK